MAGTTPLQADEATDGEVNDVKLDLLEQQKQESAKKEEFWSSANKLILMVIGIICAGVSFNGCSEDDNKEAAPVRAEVQMLQSDMKDVEKDIKELDKECSVATQKAEQCLKVVDDLRKERREDMKELRTLIKEQNTLIYETRSPWSRFNNDTRIMHNNAVGGEGGPLPVPSSAAAGEAP